MQGNIGKSFAAYNPIQKINSLGTFNTGSQCLVQCKYKRTGWPSQLLCCDWMYSALKICLIVPCVWRSLCQCKLPINCPGCDPPLYADTHQLCCFISPLPPDAFDLASTAKAVALRPVTELFSWGFPQPVRGGFCFPLHFPTFVCNKNALPWVLRHLWRNCQGRRKGGWFLYLPFWQVLQISHISLFIQVRYRIFNFKYFT